MTTKKTTKKAVKKDQPEQDLLSESIELSQAFINEIDNLMSSKLSVNQTGKILADIVSSFSTQVEDIKQRST